MIQKNPDGFDTVWKLGNDLEKSRQLWNCPENGRWSEKIRMVLKPSGKWEMVWKNLDSIKIFPDEPKNFHVAMLPRSPGFCTSQYLQGLLVAGGKRGQFLLSSTELYLRSRRRWIRGGHLPRYLEIQILRIIIFILMRIKSSVISTIYHCCFGPL